MSLNGNGFQMSNRFLKHNIATMSGERPSGIGIDEVHVFILETPFGPEVRRGGFFFCSSKGQCRDYHLNI